MSAINNLLNRHVVMVHIGTLAATATLPALYLPQKSRIKSVKFLDGAGIAMDATNHLGISLDIVGGAQVAAKDTNAAAAVVNVGLDVPLVGAVSGEVEIAAGSSLSVTLTKNGTGVPTQAKLAIEYYPL